jgi:dTDP-4-dehydrorhamnose 3,5-epimerase
MPLPSSCSGRDLRHASLRARAHAASPNVVVRLGRVQIRELAVPDAYAITPDQHADDRGVFLEWYRFDRLEETIGHALRLRQANTSISGRGVVRGIHYADVPDGQAKYVTVTRGSALDFVIDIRVGSPTFGRWDSVVLDDVDRRAVYIAEGLGHCFVATEDRTTLSYLVSDVYAPEREHAIDPLDTDIALDMPFARGELVLSPKDLDAPGLAESAASGLLPRWGAVRDFYRSLDHDGR